MDKTLHERISAFHQQNDFGIYYCGKRERTKNHEYGPEIRSHYLFVLVNEGSAVLHSNNEMRFGEHDMLIMFPEHRVHYSALSDWSISWIGFYGQTVERMIAHLGITPDHPIVHIHCYQEVSRIFSEIYELSAKGQSFENDLEITKLTYEFFQHLFSNTQAKVSIDPIEEAVKMIDLNYNTAIKITDIADKLYLNPVYLGKLFKSRVGIPPKQYILNKRMERAKYLLEHTDSTVNEISNSVGYADSLYFSRIFRQHCAMSPTEYRSNTCHN